MPTLQRGAAIPARFARGIRGTDTILNDSLPQIAFIGRSNVGKSSVINALLGSTLARSSSLPGKTQEINFYLVDERAYFCDLPGYGYARVPGKVSEKLRKLILWYFTSGEVKPVRVVLIVDAKVGPTPLDNEMYNIISAQGYPLLVIANKLDKLTQAERKGKLTAVQRAFPEAEVVGFSAVKYLGRNEVIDRLFQ